MSFFSDAVAAGFTTEQAKFLDERLAEQDHGHDIEDVEGLEEALEDCGEIDDEEGDET